MAAGREIVFPGASPIIGGARVLPSPSQFFLTGEDRLRVVSANSLTGVSLKIQWRTAIPTGAVIPSSQDHTPNSDRSVKTQDYELGTGSLLNVTVFVAAGAPLVGQTYVMIQLVRGFGTAAIVLGTLLAGYVTAVQALGFPGSPIVASTEGEPFVRVVQGATPVGDGDIQEVVPAGARWELLTWNFTFVASAAVANRVVYFKASVLGVLGVLVVHTSAIVAGETWSFSCAPNLPYVHSATTGRAQVPLPQRLVAPTSALFSTSAVNMNVNDHFSVVSYMVREWLEVS